MTTLKSVLQILGFCVLILLRAFALSLLDGAIVAVIAAAIFGFGAWLVGAHEPRLVALNLAGISGLLWTVVLVIRDLWMRASVFTETVQRLRVQKALEEE